MLDLKGKILDFVMLVLKKIHHSFNSKLIGRKIIAYMYDGSYQNMLKSMMTISQQPRNL